MLKGLVPFLKARENQEIIKKLAWEIKKDYSENTELILICPLRGSIFFSLILFVNFKCRYRWTSS